MKLEEQTIIMSMMILIGVDTSIMLHSGNSINSSNKLLAAAGLKLCLFFPLSPFHTFTLEKKIKQGCDCIVQLENGKCASVLSELCT